jgi:hypothetical protein
MNKKWKHHILIVRKYKAKEMVQARRGKTQRKRRVNQCHIERSRKNGKRNESAGTNRG